MNMNASVRSEVFTYADDAINVTVMPHTIAQPLQIARYFTEDLTEFLRQTHIDLIGYLGIANQPDYPQDLDSVVNLLYDDIAHMIRDGLISAINILISHNQPDPQFPGVLMLRYHATYLIGAPVRSLLSEPAQRYGGNLAPPRQTWSDGNFRFDLLIDWNAAAGRELRRRAVRPLYLFDWVPEESSFDGSNLVRYRSGGMTMDGAVLVRREEAADFTH